ARAFGAGGGGAVHRGLHEQVRHGGRPGAAGPGGAGGAGPAEEVRVSGGRDSGDPGVGEGGDGRGREGRQGQRVDSEADGGGGHVHSDAGAGDRQAAADGGGGRVFDLGAGDGGDGAGGAGQGEGGGQGGDRGAAGHAGDGGDGGGDVPQVDGRGDCGGQHRAAAARGGEGRPGAGDGGVRAEVDHAAHEVHGVGVRADEGGRGPAHAVFQRVPAAVLLSDDGRDGGGEAAGGAGDGDAGRQRGHGDRPDHADRDGRRVAVRNPRGRAHGGRRRRHQGHRVGTGERHARPGHARLQRLQ